MQELPNLPADVALLVLLAAVLHASWNAIAKSGASKLLDLTAMTVAAGALCAAGGTLFALGNSAIIAGYTLVDGHGTRLSASPVLATACGYSCSRSSWAGRVWRAR